MTKTVTSNSLRCAIGLHDWFHNIDDSDFPVMIDEKRCERCGLEKTERWTFSDGVF